MWTARQNPVEKRQASAILAGVRRAPRRRACRATCSWRCVASRRSSCPATTSAPKALSRASRSQTTAPSSSRRRRRPRRSRPRFAAGGRESGAAGGGSTGTAAATACARALRELPECRRDQGSRPVGTSHASTARSAWRRSNAVRRIPPETTGTPSQLAAESSLFEFRSSPTTTALYRRCVAVHGRFQREKEQEMPAFAT